MARSRWGVLAWPGRYWARQSLRARLTLLATALFSIAVATGAVLLVELQRQALTRVLDASALRAANGIAAQISGGSIPRTVTPTTGGVTAVQVLDQNDLVVSSNDSLAVDHGVSLLSPAQLRAARAGARFEVTNVNGVRERVVAKKVGSYTVVVFTDVTRINDSVRVLTRASLIGAPIAVLLVGLSTYLVVALTLRSVRALRHGAADIAEKGLAGQRLPVPTAQDEIHRLATTLNQMLDRIESAASRQRTFVGDAAHELRSPLASLRVQLEVSQRLGPDGDDWPAFIDEVLIDVGRLDRLVEDLLALARLDETGGGPGVREELDLGDLVRTVATGYEHARVPVVVDAEEATPVHGDADGLRRVIVNLVDNAQRYAHDEVRVQVRPGAGVGVTKKTVTLTVTDDGPGLPESERERVFDRFYRTEESRSRDSGGTGLGLPIVRDLVRVHHGSVTLCPRPDGEDGLQAVVLLPQAQPQR